MLLRNSWTSDRGNFSELPSGYLVSINSVLKLDADSRKAHVARGTRGNRGNAHRKSEMQSCWWAVIGAQFKTDSKFGYCIGGGGKLMNWTPSQSTSLWGLGDHLFHVISNRHRFYLSLSLTTCTLPGIHVLSFQRRDLNRWPARTSASQQFPMNITASEKLTLSPHQLLYNDMVLQVPSASVASRSFLSSCDLIDRFC